MNDAHVSPTTDQTASSPRGIAITLVALVIVLAAWAIIFARAMDRDLNHDEHQFLAPAALVAREGLQPWRDFPLYHLPNLVFLYAGMDRLTGNLVLGAKLLHVIGSAGLVLGLVIFCARRRSCGGLLVALAAVALLLTDPLFRFTTGKTWNHELPAALLIAGGGLILVGLRRDQLWITACAGICAGLAAGCRLTFAPPLAGLFFFALLSPLPARRRVAHAAILVVATTAALAPSLYYLATETERFVFSNFEFAKLRLTDPDNLRVQKTASFARKLRYFAKDIVLPSWPIFAAWLLTACAPGWRWLRTRRQEQPLGSAAAALWLILFPLALAGCLTPLRYQYQHYYVLIPLVLTAVVACSARYLSYITRYQLLTIALLAGIGVVWNAAGRKKSSEPPLPPFQSPAEWYPERLQRQAAEIRTHLPRGAEHGRVLTLAPSMPLATGLKIYPEFATGVFGWRSASLVPPRRRERLHLIAPEDLQALFRRESPVAILTGVEEEEEEAPLEALARLHGYKEIPLRKKRTLWVSQD